jgi:hypothetical protein
MVKVLSRAVSQRQRVPESPRELNIDGTRISLTPDDVTAARYRARGSRKPHNLARVVFVKAILETLARRLAEAIGTELATENRDEFLNALRDSSAVRREVNLCWMPLTAEGVLRDLYADPARLDAAAPQLPSSERRRLRRDRDAPWSPEDVALLDELAELLGEDEEPAQLAAARAAVERGYEVEYAGRVLDLAGELTGESEAVTTADALAERYLGGSGRRRSIADRAWEERAWVYAHIVVDVAHADAAVPVPLDDRGWRHRADRLARRRALLGSDARVVRGKQVAHRGVERQLPDPWACDEDGRSASRAGRCAVLTG